MLELTLLYLMMCTTVRMCKQVVLDTMTSIGVDNLEHTKEPSSFPCMQTLDDHIVATLGWISEKLLPLSAQSAIF